MGYTIPPPPLTSSEFNKRVAAGAKTMREIDPALFEWLDRGRQSRMIGVVAIAMALTVLVLVSAARFVIMSIGAA